MFLDEPGGYTGRSNLTLRKEPKCSGCIAITIEAKKQGEILDMKTFIIYDPNKGIIIHGITDYSKKRMGQTFISVLYRKYDKLIPTIFCPPAATPWHPQIEAACKIQGKIRKFRKYPEGVPIKCTPTHICLRDPEAPRGLQRSLCRKSCDSCDTRWRCQEF